MSVLFQITNKHIAECGDAPGLPADFETGPYYRAYFENPHGEQWVLWFNYETKELNLRCGDCGWEKPHKIVAVTIGTVLDVLSGLRRKKKITGVDEQWLLAGQHGISRMLGSMHQEPLLFVLDKNNGFVTCNGPEQIWLTACVLATRVEIEPLTSEAFRELVLKDKG